MMTDLVQKKFVFAGPLQCNDNVGGVVVLFRSLVDCAADGDIVLDTNGCNYRYRILLVLKFLLWCVQGCTRKYEIALHGTSADFTILGVVLVFFHLFFGLKYHCRKFAGDFDARYEKMNFLSQLGIRVLLRHSECNFFETMGLVDYFGEFNARTYWFPNYRSASSHRTRATFSGKLVFVGQVRREKGVTALLELSQALPDGWSIDIYGPLIDYSSSDLAAGGRVAYRGSIRTEDVTEVLATYDCLLLPSLREGYPGVVIEAFSVGLPVIATNLPSLREMIDDSCGVLVKYSDPSSLLYALHLIEKEYSHYLGGAVARFKKFEKNEVLRGYFSAIGRPLAAGEGHHL